MKMASELRYRTVLAFYRVWRAVGGPAYVDEIRFWGGILRRSALLFDPKARAMAVPAELRRCAVELATEFHHPPRLLEVGSGPLSLLAGAVDEGFCAVVAVDPLARVYRQLLDRHGIAYPIQPRVGHGSGRANRMIAAIYAQRFSDRRPITRARCSLRASPA